jgi:outer membrane protein
VKALRLAGLFLCIFIAQYSMAQTREKWSLEKCIDHAMKNNLQVLQGGINAEVNKNNYNQSFFNLLPSINGFVTNDISNGQQFSLAAFRVVNQTTTTFSTGLNADLTLFAGLQQVHNILKSKRDLEAAKFDKEDLKTTVTLNITTAFLQLMNNREVLNVAENQKKTTEVQVQNIEQRFKAGVLPETSLLDIQAQLARDEAAIVNAKNSYELAVLALRILLQLKPEEPFEPEIPTLKEEVTDKLTESTALSTYNTALLTQPSIKAAMARVQSAQFSRKIALGALSPTISMSGSLYDYYTNQQKQLDTAIGDYVTVPISNQFKDQFRKSISFTLSIPIFSRWQRMTNISNAKLQYQNSVLQLETKKNALMQTIYEADASARAAAEAYFSSKKSYEAAKRAYDAQEKRYSAGASSNIEYQTAKNNLATAESDVIRNKYTYVFRLKVLDFYQGKPITLNP